MTFDKVILGENCEYPTDCNVTGLNNNVLVCGSAGSGKSMSIAEPRLLETYSSSLVCTVTKRRIVTKYTQMFLQRGYEVWDLNFVEPLRGNIGYDPLLYVRNTKDIKHLANSIFKTSTPRVYPDPFWEQSSISLLEAEIAYTLATHKKATLANVMEMHENLVFNVTNDNEDELTQTNYEVENLPESELKKFLVSRWNTFKKTPSKTAACIFSTLNAAIGGIANLELQKVVSLPRKINFEKLASTKTVLFVTTSPVNSTVNAYVNIFYGQLFKQLFEFAEKRPNGVLPRPVHVLCDDFATGGKIADFPEYISIFREKGISVTLLLQSESQLSTIYGYEQATTIINNCDSYVYMGGMDIQTAKSVSVRLDVPLMDVLTLPVNKEVLFRRGQRPMVPKRYDIKKNELFQEVTKQYEEQITALEESEGDSVSDQVSHFGDLSTTEEATEGFPEETETVIKDSFWDALEASKSNPFFNPDDFLSELSLEEFDDALDEAVSEREDTNSELEVTHAPEVKTAVENTESVLALDSPEGESTAALEETPCVSDKTISETTSSLSLREKLSQGREKTIFHQNGNLQKHLMERRTLNRVKLRYCFLCLPLMMFMFFPILIIILPLG